MHKVYKLLRNNQQTGPYSLDELVALQLKPFDLIWEEGRSGGWSYPCEIDALKFMVAEAAPASPVRDEDPLGKKMPVESGVETPKQQVYHAVIPQTVAPAAKHIFVRLPGGAQAAATGSANNALTAVAEDPRASAGEESPEQKLERKAMELRQRVQAIAETRKAAEEEPSLDTKYSRSLDDIKEEYTHWMRTQKRQRRSFPLTRKQLAIAIVVLVAGVAIAGWVSSYFKASESVVAHPARLADQPLESPGKPTGNAEAPTLAQKEFDKNTRQLHELEDANKLIAEDLERLSVAKTEKAVSAGEEDFKEEDWKDPVADRTDIAIDDSAPDRSAQAEREPVSNSERQSAKRSGPGSASLAQQIEVRAKYMGTGKRRGIAGLELTVQNNSNEVLKFVAVDVFYYRDQDQLVAKETLYFNNLRPQDVLTLQAPGNRKASTARYQLGLISSEEGALYVVR